ncbi:MAG TPA: hypothetical protein VIJ14_06140 [Rhabdochlamydiaceae bacterium]
MASVGFWTPVTYLPFVPSLGRRVLENVDAYFCRDGKKVCVIQGYERGNSEGVLPFNEQPSRTTLKVISYCTLIIPALVFIAKVVLRYIYTFHLITQTDSSPRPPPFIGCADVPPSSSSPPTSRLPSHQTSRLLEFDRTYRLSCAETAKLFIQIPYENRGHDLPQTQTDFYRVPPSVNIGFSQLPEYQDSYFEYEYCKSSSSGELEIEVVRKNKSSIVDPSFLLTARNLTIEETIDLKLVPCSDGLAVSIRKEFNGFLFEYRFNAGNNTYSVKKIPAFRGYPFLPFNEGVNLRGTDIRMLGLINTETKEFNGWAVRHSSLPEYANSVLLIKETSGETAIFVRMLKV